MQMWIYFRPEQERSEREATLSGGGSYPVSTFLSELKEKIQFEDSLSSLRRLQIVIHKFPSLMRWSGLSIQAYSVNY